MFGDRRFQIGAAVAVALGAFTLYQRKKSTGSTDSDQAAVISPGSASYPGTATYDSTATDVAAWLGDYSGALQGQLNDYQSQLADAIAALGQLQSQTPLPTPEQPTETETETPAAGTTTSKTYVLPKSMTAREVAQAIYGSGAASAWNGAGGRLYWSNEGVIVGSARDLGATGNYYDAQLPAGLTLQLP